MDNCLIDPQTANCNKKKNFSLTLEDSTVYKTIRTTEMLILHRYVLLEVFLYCIIKRDSNFRYGPVKVRRVLDKSKMNRQIE